MTALNRYKSQLEGNLYILAQMNNDTNIEDYEQKKLLDELHATGTKEQPQEEDVECVDTKIWIWDGDQYEQFDSDYLNQIYPYKLNKKTMAKDSQFIFHFLSSSLHYWVELVQEGEPEPDKLGKKDCKVISEILQTDESDNCIAFHRWGEQFNKQQQYHKHQQEQNNFVEPEGEIIHTYTRGQDEFIIKKYTGDNKQFYKFKQRMEVLLLFYIDGVSFIFEELDTWIYYVIFKKVKGAQRKLFVGMLSKYVFRLSALKQRHRISQVFILPTYQKSGHGKQLIDTVYNISLQDPKCFQITTEIPSFEYQCLRDYKQLQMILNSKIIDLEELNQLKKVVTNKQIDQNRASLLTKENVKKIKQSLKIPGHQIERLVNILIYHKIQSQKEDMPKAYFEEDLRQKIIVNRSPFKTRRKMPHLTLYGKVPNLKDFMLQKSKQDMLRNQEQVQEILTETINGFNRVISKSIKAKLLE